MIETDGNGVPAEAQFMRLLAGKAPRMRDRKAGQSGALLDLLLHNWQILPTIEPATLAKVLEPEDLERFGRARLAVVAFEQAQIAGCADFLAALDAVGVRYTLLKGAAAGCLLYPERKHRAAWDFDLGVAWDDIETAEATALESGFCQAQRDADKGRFVRADRELRAIVEETHFELGFLARRLLVTNLSDETKAAIRDEPWAHQFWHDAETDRPWCYAVVDIHHKLSLDIELGGMLSSCWRKDCNGTAISVPDLAWFAFHLVFKLYWESVHKYGKGLYQYADLIRLIPMLDAVTFARFITLIEDHSLVAAAYHTFKHLPDFGVRLPQHIRDFLDRAGRPGVEEDPIEANDLGDMWPKLWGRR